MNTIVYLTDNSLDEKIAATCRRLLVREAGELPIVSVSQRPVDLGINIVVGEIGRSWLSLYGQLLAGIEAAPTDWVVVAEHDVIYGAEHLHYEPDDASVFHYNSNCWLVVGPGSNHPDLFGMFSYWPRRLALSQLICEKTLLRECITERLAILEKGARIDREYLGCGEPGVVSERAMQKAARAAASGQPWQLQRYLRDYLQKYDHKSFNTNTPNIDIRHGTNWTGPKRGKMRRYELPHWGRFEDVING